MAEEDISVAKGGRLQVEDEKGRKLFVSLKDAVNNLTSKNEEQHVKEMAQARLDQSVAESNTESLISNMVEAKSLEEQKEKHQEFIKRTAERELKIQNGEYGFRGLFKNGTQSLKNQLMMDKTFAEGLGEVGDAFKNDLQFVGQMLSPLTAIPGVNTALTGLKFIAGQAFSLTSKEGRENAKRWMMDRKTNLINMKNMIAQKAAVLQANVIAMKDLAVQKLKMARDKLTARARGLKSKGGDLKANAKSGANKIWLLVKKLFKGIAVVILGIIAFTINFFKSIGSQLAKLFAGPWNKVKGLFKNFKLPAFLTNAINGIKGIFGKTGGLGRVFQKIKDLFKPVLKTISTLMKSPVVQFMGSLGANLGKFFIPLTILMGAWQAIKGLIDGWKSTEGTWGDKIIGGLAGITESLINFFIMMPLDLIKDMLAWLGEKLGLIGPDTKAMINEFSFADLFSKLWEGLVNIGLAIKNWVAAVLAGAWAGIKAAWPGGESPMGAFKRVYNEKLNSGGGTYKGSMSGGKETGEQIKEASEENKRAEDEKTATIMATEGPNGSTQVISQNTNINQAAKNTTVNTGGPVDPIGAYASAVP